MSENDKLSSELTPLETFPSRAFMPDSEIPRTVCAFVLTLGLVYNDLKDILIGSRSLEAERPEGTFVKTKAWGQYNGLRLHLVRVALGLYHELLVLISGNQRVILEASFLDTIKHIQRDSRESWEAIVAAALKQPHSSDLSKALALIRNTVSFHYDPKRTLRGYEVCFDSQNTDSVPYISRGNTMLATRFYFVDAAADASLKQCMQNDEVRRQLTQDSRFLEEINLALHEIVLTFIQRRGCAWRSVQPST